MRLLVVEDDERIAAALAEDLTDQHYAVDVANDGTAGWELVEAFPYDLIVLDVMLPGMDGIEFCQRVRSHGFGIPVLMLTARDTTADKVMGLDVGADDYMVKPFELQELSARIRALLRRGATSQPPVLEWGEATLDPNLCEVYYRKQQLPLTPKEYQLLELFMRHSRRVFSRSDILEHLWPYAELPEEETVKAHVKGLRHKLKSAGAPADFIETVYGLGYRLNQAL
ncbi:MAG: response regulator transcription factor [Cyanobacteria bacterium J06642_2]